MKLPILIGLFIPICLGLSKSVHGQAGVWPWPDSLNLPDTGGSFSVTVYAYDLDGPTGWSVDSGWPSWITSISPQSGSDSDTCTITVAPNGTGSIRSYTLGFQTSDNLYTGSLSISQAKTLLPQTITWTSPPPSSAQACEEHALAATSTSGQTVTFSASPPGEINGSTLRFTGSGSVEVTASVSGNSDYAAATDSRPVSVSKCSASLIFNLPSTASKTDSIALSASSDSDGTITFSVISGPGSIDGSNVLTFSNAGVVEVRATVSTTNLYHSASIDESINVNHIDPTTGTGWANGYYIGPGEDLSGADLSGTDLSGANLTGANLTDADLTGANLRLANLADATLTGADLTDTDLYRVRSGGIIGVPFSLPAYWQLTNGYLVGPEADLTGANLTGASFNYANLTGADLTGANLSYASLAWVNLTGADLSGADLSNTSDCNNLGCGIDFTGANLSGADLTNAYLKNAIFLSADLTSAKFTGATLDLSDLSNVNLGAVDLTSTSLINVDLINVNLSEVDLRGTNLTGSNLTHANLSGVDLTDTNLTDGNLRYADLSGTQLTNTNLTDGDLRNADLSGAQLTNTRLSGANLYAANLNGVKSYSIIGIPSAFPSVDWLLAKGYLIGPKANLTDADLTYVNLNNADLRDTILSGANLTGADMSGANLTAADMTGADLTYVGLNNADLRDTILSGANLTGADITGANLTGADMTGANLTGIIGSSIADNLFAIIASLQTELASKYTLSEIADLRPGSSMIEIIGGEALLNFKVQESDNLIDWTDTAESTTVTVPVPDPGKKFFRFSGPE